MTEISVSKVCDYTYKSLLHLINLSLYGRSECKVTLLICGGLNMSEKSIPELIFTILVMGVCDSYSYKRRLYIQTPQIARIEREAYLCYLSYFYISAKLIEISEGHCKLCPAHVLDDFMFKSHIYFRGKKNDLSSLKCF